LDASGLTIVSPPKYAYEIDYAPMKSWSVLGTFGPIPSSGSLLIPTSQLPQNPTWNLYRATWSRCTSSGNLLNIDFGAPTTTKTGVAAVGLSSADVWNPAGVHQGDYTLSGLVWADNTPIAGASVEAVNLGGTWGATSAIHDAMYDNYSYSFSGTTASVKLSGLPAGTYDLYVYASVPNGTTGASVSLQNEGTTTTTRYTSRAAFASDTTWQSGQQYVAFPGLSMSAADRMTINLTHGIQGTGNAGIVLNGLQVVKH
jgi:hypothetical protein